MQQTNTDIILFFPLIMEYGLSLAGIVVVELSELDRVGLELEGVLTVEIIKQGTNVGNMILRVTPMTIGNFTANYGSLPAEFTAVNLDIPDPAERELFSDSSEQCCHCHALPIDCGFSPEMRNCVWLIMDGHNITNNDKELFTWKLPKFEFNSHEFNI